MTDDIKAAVERIERYLKAKADADYYSMSPTPAPPSPEDLQALVEAARRIRSAALPPEGWTPDNLIKAVIQDVCDLPDRTSPEGWPEALIVTGEELDAIIRSHFEQFARRDIYQDVNEAVSAILALPELKGVGGDHIADVGKMIVGPMEEPDPCWYCGGPGGDGPRNGENHCRSCDADWPDAGGEAP